MAESPADVTLVLNAIAAQAATLCHAPFARVTVAQDGVLRVVAGFAAPGHRRAPARDVPLRRTSIQGRALIDRKTLHFADIVPLLDKEFPDARENARVMGFRAVLAVPLVRGDDGLGAMFLYRREPGFFAPDQVALVETFARQAAIALQNVRQFQATREALEQQTATSDILRVISQSPTDVRPVFETIAQAALTLCHAVSSTVHTYDGELLHIGALASTTPEGAEALRAVFPRPASRDMGVTRAVFTRALVHIPDILADPDYATFESTRAMQASFRSVLAVPLMHEGTPIGAISVGRPDPGPFPASLVALLKTFADQAVIAIENVRLFTELGARNSELTEALEQQTATSEILRVISSTPTDVQPVFETIAESVLTLCGAHVVNVFTFDGSLIHLRALVNVDPAYHEAIHGVFPRAPGRDTAVGRSIQDRDVVVIPDILADPEYRIGPQSMLGGYRRILAVPLLRDGIAIGGITVGAPEPGSFPGSQIALLRTFADQAVIAIENVRLFTELGARNRELTEALEQQTATSEILRVISRSRTDVQPVFDVIAENTLRLCDGVFSGVFRFDGELIHVGALRNINPEGAAAFHAVYPCPPSRGGTTQRAILTRSIVHMPDIQAESEYVYHEVARTSGFRSVLSVPMMRDGAPIGAIAVYRDVARPFPDAQIELLKTFAEQAVIAIENVRLFNELEKRNADLTEALEQQTATSDILRVISQSPTDVQPVFDTIAAAALKLCGATNVNVFTFDGALIHLAALVNLTPAGEDAIRSIWPQAPSRGMAASRAIVTGRPVEIPDVLEDPDFSARGAAVAGNFRSILAVPLTRESRPIGAIAVGRPEPGRFPDSLAALLATFADQAVIAIENVRLFTELGARNRDLTEALEQQTATSDILRVISQSQTDVQPVFDTIAASVLKLCRARFANVFTYDGELIHLAAFVNDFPEYIETVRSYYPQPPGRNTAVTRAIATGDVSVIPDVLADNDYQFPAASAGGGFRSILAVPLMREGKPVGGIALGRPEPGQFPDSQIALLQTFADQAVIAIENVRLFTELQARNGELTEALEQQTATSEILRVISRSQSDVQPVFETIVRSVLALCDARFSGVYLLDGDTLSLAATAGLSDKERAAFHAGYPRKVGRDTVSGLAALECRVVQTLDLMSDPQYAGAPGTRVGARTVLGVPLVRDGRSIGSIGVWRSESKAFSETQIALLQTFADQAVIAIENVRLFNEVQARTAQLTRSVGELKALGEVGQAVSSTLDVETVLGTIVARATQLTGMDGGSIYEYDEARKEFHLHSANGLPPEVVEALRSAPIRKGEGALGKLATTGHTVEIPDIADERVYQSRVRKALMRIGYRSMLVVPLLREDHLLGGLVVNRRATGAFDPQVIDLLKTFATQSAIAIQNARLFREIETKSRELETASRHKSEFLANMSHELRTPLNAIIGFSEVLSERLFGDMNDKQAEYVQDISESGRHLLALINDILDLSKIEAGRMELEPSDFDLGKLVAQTLTLLRERAERRGHRARFDGEPRHGDGERRRAQGEASAPQPVDKRAQVHARGRVDPRCRHGLRGPRRGLGARHRRRDCTGRP
jgi:GAF domain-containing protein